MTRDELRRDEEYARFSGGAGARTQPLCDEDYKREMRKLEQLEAADSQ